MEPKSQTSNEVPPSGAELGTRIADISKTVGGKRALAKRVGVGEQQIYRWIKGENEPAVSKVVQMANAAGVSVEWLATGTSGADPVEVREPGADYGAGPDGDLVAQVAAELYELVMTEGLALPPEAFAICVRAAARLKAKEPGFAVRDVIRDVLGP